MYKVKQAKAVWQVWCVDVVLEDRMDGKEVLYNVKVTTNPRRKPMTSVIGLGKRHLLRHFLGIRCIIES